MKHEFTIGFRFHHLLNDYTISKSAQAAFTRRKRKINQHGNKFHTTIREKKVEPVKAVRIRRFRIKNFFPVILKFFSLRGKIVRVSIKSSWEQKGKSSFKGKTEKRKGPLQ